MNNLILFGGTFDPIHLGHIQTAINIQKKYNFDQFIFLPCKIPVLKKPIPHASVEDRLSMLELGISPYKTQYHFAIDPREINRDTPSYTVPTLQAYRAEYGHDLPITLLIGQDTFQQLPQWFKWEQIITLANILIIHRDESQTLPIADCLKSLLTTHKTNQISTLLNTSNGLIAEFNAGHFAISSTQIRQALRQKDNKAAELLNSTVYEYIQQKHLYLGQ